MTPSSPGSASGLATVGDALPHLLISVDALGGADFVNRGWREFVGAASHPGETTDWAERVHEDDRARLRQLVARAFSHGEAIRMECRLRDRNDGCKWFLAQSGTLGGPEGAGARQLITFTEIQSLKHSEQVYMTLANELGHRVKNIFAIFSSLARLSAAKHPSAAEFAAELEARVGALAIASDLAAPAANPAAEPATLRTLFDQLLSPYRIEGENRIRIDLENLNIGLTGANSLALLIHEQATNAVKYGALSSASGELHIRGRRADRMYVITWEETGGPAMIRPPQHKGFGSRLMDQTVSRQLAGRIDRRWEPEGLAVEMHLLIERLQS